MEKGEIKQSFTKTDPKAYFATITLSHAVPHKLIKYYIERVAWVVGLMLKVGIETGRKFNLLIILTAELL